MHECVCACVGWGAVPMGENSVPSLLIVLTQVQVCYWRRNAMINGIVSRE